MRLSLAQVVPSLGDKGFRAYVLYGANEPLVQGIIQEINQCFTHTTIGADQLGIYRDDLDTPLLFGEKPYVVHVEGSISWPVVGPILRTWPRNHAVVVRAATCPLPWSKSSEIAAVACYDCSLVESKTITQRYMNREQIGLSPSALQWCAMVTQSGQWHSVIGVMGLFAGPEKQLDLEDLHGFFPEYWDALGLAILDGPKARFHQEEIDDPIKMIRSWQRAIMQLWQLKYFLNSQSQEKALDSVRPLIFFKHKDSLINACKSWSKQRIIRCLGQLIQTETALKKDPHQATALLVRLLRQA